MVEHRQVAEHLRGGFEGFEEIATSVGFEKREQGMLRMGVGEWV